VVKNKTLDDHFSAAIRKSLRPEVVLSEIIAKLLRESGITLSAKNISDIRRQVRGSRGGSEGLTINIDDSGHVGLTEVEARARVESALKGLSPAVQRFMRRYTRRLPGMINDAVVDVAAKYVEGMRRARRLSLQSHRKVHQSFCNDLRSSWRPALDAMETQIGVSREIGYAVAHGCVLPVERLRRRGLSRLNVLVRLQARAMRIASETLVLMNNGYADGAHARWRSLHEVAVVAAFIEKFGNKAARLFLDHETWEVRRSARAQMRVWPNLVNDREFMKQVTFAERRLKALTIRHGKGFDDEYGWAAPFVKGRPTLRELEAAVDLSIIRPHYQVASYNVHAGPKGIAEGLAHGGELSRDVIFAGPSPFGLDEVGKLVAWSLLIITNSLLIKPASLESLAYMHVVFALSQETTDAFERAAPTKIDEIPTAKRPRRKGRQT
jgi:Family of unknown function (DUF5677)